MTHLFLLQSDRHSIVLNISDIVNKHRKLMLSML